jgi:hypothetical protein
MLPLSNTAHSCTNIESEGPTARQTASSDFHARAKVSLPVAGKYPCRSRAGFRLIGSEKIWIAGSVAFASALVRD